MRSMLRLLLIGTLAAGLGACANHGSKPAEPARTFAPAPAGSPLSKVQVGMTEQEVRAVLGPPSQENEYVTGKAFIPWYFGPDRSRRAYFYKGMGRVVFAGGKGFNRTGHVQRVEYDPSEPGYAR